MRLAEAAAQRVSQLDVEIAVGLASSLADPSVAGLALELREMECASGTSKSVAVARGCVFEDRSENQVQRCDGGRSKVVHLFPEPEPGCHFGTQTRGLGPILLLSSLALAGAAVTLDQLNEVLVSQSEERDQC